MIQRGRPEDRAAIEAIVHGAYSVYIEEIGKPPGPMHDDYEKRIADGSVHVLTDTKGTIVGIIVLLPAADYLLLDNVAVHPDRQGRGYGRALISFAEGEALRLGLAELRLYTHEKMTANIAFYGRLGFEETGRGHQAGYDRVFMRKHLAVTA